MARRENIQRGSRLGAVIGNGSVEIQFVRAHGPVAVEERDARIKGSFENVLAHLRSIAGTEAERGRLFERLMKADLRADPLYQDRFSSVCLWSE